MKRRRIESLRVQDIPREENVGNTAVQHGLCESILRKPMR